LHVPQALIPLTTNIEFIRRNEKAATAMWIALVVAPAL
jgi:hypothetical protein